MPGDVGFNKAAWQREDRKRNPGKYKDYAKRCRVKTTLRQRERRREHPEKLAEQNRRKDYKDLNKSRAYYREYSLRWIKEHPEYGKIRAAAYYARRRGAHFLQIPIEKVFEKTGPFCILCGEFIEIRQSELDHIIPLVKGGTGFLENLQVVHRKCNRIKGAA